MQNGKLIQNETFLKSTYHKALFPCMLSILSGNINILADGILVSRRLGTQALAAINLCVPVYLLLCIAGSFLTAGTAIPAARALGEGKNEKALHGYQTAVSSLTITAVFITAAGLLLLRPITVFLCPDAQLQQMVFVYAGVTLAGALPKLMIYVPFWFLRLEGKNGTVTWMMCVMAIGNVLLDVWFLYVINWGVFGAALASVLATAAACAVGFAVLCRKNGSFRLKWFCVREKAAWKEIIQAGSPSAANNLFQTLRLLAINSLLLKNGGSAQVAVFTAVNCIAAFSMCITDGVAQAASAMLGIYAGERDNSSIRLLLKREWKSGFIGAVVFALLTVSGSRLIAGLYGLEKTSLQLPLLCLGISLPFGLGCSILSGYYNTVGKNGWANTLIFSRVFFFAAGSLWLLCEFHLPVWWFLVLSEILTIVLWYLASAFYHQKKKKLSRFLFMDDALEREGRVISFSVEGSVESVCEASEKIAGFCEENGRSPKQTMRIGLSMEEIMTMILKANEKEPMAFDARAFCIQDTFGIRIRYAGIPYNPFAAAQSSEDEGYMGIRMIQNMAHVIVYQQTVGVNTLQILL